VVYGANDSVLEITYENGKRLQEAYFHGGELNRFFVYRYYFDDGNLYRIYAYDKDSVQVSYRNFEYFSTGQTRISSFTVDHKLIGREVYNSQNGLLTFVQFTDSTGTVTERADYIYDAALNLTERTELRAEQTYKSVFFIIEFSIRLSCLQSLELTGWVTSSNSDEGRIVSRSCMYY